MLFRIVIAFAFFVFSLKANEQETKNFYQLHKKCETENGLVNDEIQQIKMTQPIETDNINIKCYFRCLLLELNLMDSFGNLIPTGVAGIKPEYRQYIVECLNTTGSEPCEKALNFENCIWTKKMAAEGN